MRRRDRVPLCSAWRLLALATVIDVGMGVGTLSAQTVVVRGAKIGSTVDLVLNAAAVGSATVGESGFTTLVAEQPPDAKPQIDALIYVDQCDDRHRVLIIERGRSAPPLESGCDRSEITGLFIVRPTSTLVVDVSTPSPSLLLRQGRYNPARGSRASATAPGGLVIFGGGTFGKFKSGSVWSCGDVSGCSGSDSGLGYTAGVAFWVVRFLAAEATYVKPVDVTARGLGTGYRFDSSTDADVLTVAAVVGIPAGSARIYGKAGGTYHHALFTTNETIRDSTITVDGVEQTVPGGTQTLQFQTEGWSWMFGGGVEVWLNRLFGWYGEAEWLSLKGKDMDGGEGVMNDKAFQFLFGARLHIGR
jgi:hypothetical protein